MIDINREDVSSVKSVARLVQNIISKLCPIMSVGLYLLLFLLVFGLGYYGILVIFTIQDQLGWWFYLHFVLIFWFIFNIIFNYVMAILTKPGTPSTIPSVLLNQIEHKCRRCKETKPPRTHHCSVCNQCVLQMDHHCPWIGTCVGHHNRRYFINFITYTTLGLAQLLVLSFFKTFDILVLTLAISLFCCLAGFSLFHWYLILKGKTSLQMCWEDPRYSPHPSLSTNLIYVFGTSNIFLGLMPSVSVLDHWGDQWHPI